MRLSDGLNIKKKDFISIVGAGGKTSVMFQLAKECKDKNLKVFVTTTTKIYYPTEDFIDNIFLLNKERIDITKIKNGTITIIGEYISTENKLIGVDKSFIDEIYRRNIFDLIIVESDGAKRKTIKAPNYNEPLIPSLTTKVIGIIGVDAIGMLLNNKNVHRVDEFSSVTGTKIGEIISNNSIKKLVVSKDGLFKNSPKNTEKILILNKADDKELQIKACKLLRSIAKETIYLKYILVISIYNNYCRRCEL
jgi:probable selenium-dependent hydroxylase accessory protein YqeC